MALAIGAGAGAELRQPPGMAIVGGLIVSPPTMAMPVIFPGFERLRGIAAGGGLRRT